MSVQKKSCDVLVVGSGAGGMATAITASLHGLDVLVVEKEQVLGGGTAWSYGTLWIPANPVARRQGIADSSEDAFRYLQHEMGESFDPERVTAFLKYGPRMIDYFERHTAVRFECRDDYPDYHSEYPGAAARGRTLFAASFDGRDCGPSFATLRPPLATQTIMGMMYSANEIKQFQAWRRQPSAFMHVARRLLRHWRDLALYGRTTRLTAGNALSARLLKTAGDLKIPLWTSAPLIQLVTRDDRVCGGIVLMNGQTVSIEARRGVVLACGGFGHDLRRCRELFARPQLRDEDWSLAPAGNTGDGLRLAERLGAEVGRSVANAGFWSPVSRIPVTAARLGGLIAGHYHDRQRPGFIAVTRQGRRFANEALSYHHFGEAIVQAAAPGEEPVAYLICDHESIRKVGCGNAILPAPFRLEPHLSCGYLMKADSIAELALKAGIDANVLSQTVEEFNAHAREGRDPHFGKGDTAFNRYFGDASSRPNPCVGPLREGPFYAVQMTVAHMGTLAGLKTNHSGGVLDANRRAIPGLYAAGNDMANLFGGACPGGGITLGPAMTFGYITGRHLAGIVDGLGGDTGSRAISARAMAESH